MRPSKIVVRASSAPMALSVEIRSSMVHPSNDAVLIGPDAAADAMAVRMLALESIVAQLGSVHSGAVDSPSTAMRTHFCTAPMLPVLVISAAHVVCWNAD